MENTWKRTTIPNLGDYIGKAIMLICEYGAFRGGLKDITAESILIETGEGQVTAIDRKVLESEYTELYEVEVI